jgi:hypothetical protein
MHLLLFFIYNSSFIYQILVDIEEKMANFCSLLFIYITVHTNSTYFWCDDVKEYHYRLKIHIVIYHYNSHPQVGINLQSVPKADVCLR